MFLILNITPDTSYFLSGPCVNEFGVTGCCEGLNCGAGISIDNDCFCDQRCFGEGDCCPDIVAIGCQPSKYDYHTIYT